MPKPRKGSRASSAPADATGLFAGLPRPLIQRLAIMRRAAPKPIDSVRRQRFMMELLAADQMKCYADDTANTASPNVAGYADTAIRLAEQIRRLSATEHEVTPAGEGGAHITHDLPGDGPGMWQGPAETTIATVTGDASDDAE